MTKEEFTAALKEKGVQLSDTQLEQFEKYLHLLQEWNKKMNLTAITEEEEIWEKHFYDSILPFIGEKFHTLADIGSGAGFPGIPVKIVWPDTEMVLLEPLQKRCRFLEEVKSALDLKNLDIVSSRAEDYAGAHRESFDMVTSRAVARLSILLELCVPLMKKGGRMIALKGPTAKEELAAAEKALPLLGVVVEQMQEEDLKEGKRINLYLRKEKKTPAKYPRSYSQIKKSPLEEKHG